MQSQPPDPALAYLLSAQAEILSDVSSDEVLSLTHEDRLSLMQIIDASFQVIKRHHFFSWSQGVVQYLIPHDILVCGMSGSSDPGMHMYYFSSTRYFMQDQFNAACQADSGLMRQLINHWDSHGQPCLIGQQNRMDNGSTAWLEGLESHELRNAAAHGMRGADGRVKSFFCFSRVAEPFPARLSYFLHVLTPFFDATLSRVLAQEERDGLQTVRAKMALTMREIEILSYLKEGHSNLEISTLLFLSPHTVKNHVRKILQKLGVQSRAQAAVKAIQMGVHRMRRD